MDCKQVRERLRLTQEQMGRAMNTSNKMISKWETETGENARKPRGQAQRLMELLLEMKKRNLLNWYYRKYDVKKG